MELLVFGHAGAKVLIFPTRGARFYEYEQLRMVDQIRDKLDAGVFQLYCLDSVDTESFYCFWAHPKGRLERHQRYEDYVMQEVFPLMDRRNPNPCVISHGCSFGAYHACNFAFRYPWKFKKLLALSGRYDLTQPVEYFADLLDGYYADDVYYHMPSHYIPNLDDERYLQPLREMDIHFVIGAEDPFLDNNRRLSDALWQKGIANQLHVWSDRAHRGYYWRRMVPLYL
ncbi:MAG: esterase [Puniceicoccaceae bacterium 5H]|nr:MAG: esterase [Puniceicoccaceae bacterium 5H]